jgi:hypothetical protein
MNRDSSVSIVSDYALDDWAIGVRFSAEAKDFSSSLSVQTSCEAHQISYPMDTGSPSPEVNCGRDVTLTTQHSPPSSAEVKNE